MIILGVDPGTRITGYGIILVEAGKLKPLDFGCIRPSPKMELAQRYLAIFEGIEHLLKLHGITALSVETQFVRENVQSAMKLGMARAAVMLAAAKKKIPIFEYAPAKAKQAAVGNGRAGKEQVQRMVQIVLGLTSIPEPEDAADALALAICHANAARLSKLSL